MHYAVKDFYQNTESNQRRAHVEAAQSSIIMKLSIQETGCCTRMLMPLRKAWIAITGLLTPRGIREEPPKSCSNL